MKPLQTDFSVYRQFDLEKPPVGAKYLFHKPEGIESLDKSLARCEMLVEIILRAMTYSTGEKNSL